jgi:hypothetical protein
MRLPCVVTVHLNSSKEHCYSVLTKTNSTHLTLEIQFMSNGYRNIVIHTAADFEGMRKAGHLAAQTLDFITPWNLMTYVMSILLAMVQFPLP